MATLTNFRERINSIGSKKSSTPTELPANNLAVATGPYNPSLPGVNLLPSIFAQRQANRGLIRRFLWAGAILVLVLGVLFGLKYAAQFFQQSQLATLQANAANYNRQIQTLQPYSTYKTSIANERTTLGKTLASDIDMANILSTLNRQAAIYQVNYSSISLSVGSTAGGCISDPFASTTTPTIGCITIAGTGPSQASVSNFFNTLNGTSGFLNAVPSSLSAANPGYSFNGSVSFNQGFYSGKYAYLNSDLDQVLNPSGTTTGSTATAGTTPLQATLVAHYPTVFKAATSTQVTTLGAKVCTATAVSVSRTTLDANVVTYGQQLQLTIPVAQANAIATDIINANCTKNNANITGGTQ